MTELRADPYPRLKAPRSLPVPLRLPRVLGVLLISFSAFQVVSAQVLWPPAGAAGAVALTETLNLSFPAAKSARFLVIEGYLPVSTPGRTDPAGSAGSATDMGDIGITLNGKARAPLSSFVLAPRQWRAHLVIPESELGAQGPTQRLELIPRGVGAILKSVRIERAGRVEVKVFEKGTRKLLPSILEVTARDGAELPRFGYFPHSLHAGPAYLLPKGEAVVYLPLGEKVKVRVWSTTFRTTATQVLRPAPGRGFSAHFELGPNLLPKDSFVLEAPWRTQGMTFSQQFLLRRLLGVRTHVEENLFSAVEASANPEAFVERLLDPDQPWPVTTDQSGPSCLPSHHRPLRTVRLPLGMVLYTNGPVISVSALLRHRKTGLVTGALRLECPREVVPGQFQIQSAERVWVKRKVGREATIPLSTQVPLASGTRLVASFMGERFQGSSLAAPAPRAYLAFRLP